jgi:hypothetical protein
MSQTTDMITPMQIVETVKRWRWYLVVPFCTAKNLAGEYHDFG